MAAVMDPLQATIENWRRKSAEVAAVSHDVVVPVMTKTFETMSAVMRSDADPLLAERALASLANERDLSMQYDNQRNDSIRDLTYDLIESVHLILGKLCATRHQSTINGYSTHAQPAPQSSHSAMHSTSAIDWDEIDAFLDNDESGVLLKEESGDATEDSSIKTRSGGDAVEAVKKSSSVPSVKSRPSKRKSSGENGDFFKSSNQLKCILCDEFGTHSVNGYLSHLNREHKTSAMKEGIFFRCPCGHECYSDIHVRNAENRCPQSAGMKIVRLGETEKATKIIRPSSISNQTEENVSTTPLQCIKCDTFTTYNVSSYSFHLRNVHGVYPTQAGISFRCACGNVCRSHSHFVSNKCRNVPITIVRDEEEKEEEEKGDESPEEIPKSSIDEEDEDCFEETPELEI